MNEHTRTPPHQNTIEQAPSAPSTLGVANPASQITMHIERLVLHGFAPGERAQIGAAVEAELTRLFAEQGLPPGLSEGGTIEQLDGGAFTRPAGMPAHATGTHIAQTLYGSLSHDRT